MKAEEFNNKLSAVLEKLIADQEEEDSTNANTTSLQVTVNPDSNGVTYIISAHVSVTFSEEEEA